MASWTHESDIKRGRAGIGAPRFRPAPDVSAVPVWTTGVWRRFFRQRLSLSGGGVLIALILCILLGPVVYPTSPSRIDFSLAVLPPSWSHPFGTNDLGQDILAQVLVGGRISLAVGICSTVVAVVVGTLIGVVAGFVGGSVDILLMRLTDLFLSLPLLPLLLLIIHLFRTPATLAFGAERGIFALIVLVIGGLTWMTVARLVRARMLSVREMDFVTAARVAGASPVRLVWSHMLPNVSGPVIVAATLSVSRAIVTEATLSFLGLGFPPDTPTWGRMLYEAKDYLDIAPHMAIFPALAVVLTVVSILLIGEGLQAALNPYGGGGRSL